MVDARDVSAQKVALLEENVRRCGFANIRTSVRDALKPDEDSEFHGEAGARMRDFVRSFV